MARIRPETDAIALLKDEHKKLKVLLEQFEAAETHEEMGRIIDQALDELKIHGEIEERLFYPALRNIVGEQLLFEADKVHHVMRMLIAELDSLDKRDGSGRIAMFTALAEIVKQHITEGEGELLPSARRADIDFSALGAQLMERRNELLESGVPEDSEHKIRKSMTD